MVKWEPWSFMWDVLCCLSTLRVPLYWLHCICVYLDVIYMYLFLKLILPIDVSMRVCVSVCMHACMCVHACACACVMQKSQEVMSFWLLPAVFISMASKQLCALLYMNQVLIANYLLPAYTHRCRQQWRGSMTSTSPPQPLIQSTWMTVCKRQLNWGWVILHLASLMRHKTRLVVSPPLLYSYIYRIGN